MKKIIALLVIISFAVSCKSTSVGNTKLDNKTELALKGNWTMASVTFPGSEYIKVTSFDLADSKCFVGSNWSFVSNNNTGTMQLANASCTSFSSKTTWYVNKEGKFVLKVLEAEKAKKVASGYILTLGAVTENTFELIDYINVGGKSTAVTYKFVR
jgi:curli biogenesis system outer membrane secretion channel CsgG